MCCLWFKNPGKGCLYIIGRLPCEEKNFCLTFSADSCLTYLTDYIKTQTSKGLYTRMLMLGLQKAFDIVYHAILCKKLKAMGIKSVDWFRSYLSNRNQIVNVNDTESGPSLVTCDDPQGSILGPLLFLCYINAMEVSKGAKITNRYNQVPHLTQDTNVKVTNSQLDTTNESQEVSPFPAGDNKAHINKRAQRHSKHKTEKKT